MEAIAADTSADRRQEVCRSPCPFATGLVPGQRVDGRDGLRANGLSVCLRPGSVSPEGGIQFVGSEVNGSISEDHKCVLCVIAQCGKTIPGRVISWSGALDEMGLQRKTSTG